MVRTHGSARLAMLGGAVLAAVVLAMYVGSFARSAPPRSIEDDTAFGDVMSGWRTFHEKQCVECHSIWDQGGSVGPDLGRIRSGRLSGTQLAGVMWNHIPKMLARIKQAGHPPATLNSEEMADIFALIYFVGQLDEPGDPAHGERILRDKGCAACHSIDAPEEGGVGPALAAWAQYANPVSWAQMMWEHAPKMEEAMKETDMSWPELQGDDLIHIVAYLRSAGISGKKSYLRPGSPAAGARLFSEKKCDTCHPGSGPDLAEIDLPDSIGALAARMWNHSPTMIARMQEQNVKLEIAPQELADILAYVLMLGRRDRGGDPARGERVFREKGCAQCHDVEVSVEPGMEGEVALPSLKDLGQAASPVLMATAMWNHGETMLEQMTAVGISWPVFIDTEMPDMLAFLKASK